MKKHARAWIKGLLIYFVGFGLLAWIISRYWSDDSKTGAPGLRTLLQGDIEYGWFVATALLLAVGVSLQLYRWYILVRSLDLPFTVRNAFRLGMVGLFCNTFIPGSVSGDLVKAIALARSHPERKTRAVATVIADRALGLFGLILFAALCGGTAWALGDPKITANPELQVMVQGTAAVGGVSIVLFLLLGLLPQTRVDRFAGRLRAIPKVGVSASEIWYVVWMYRQRLKAVAVCLVLTALSHVCLVSSFHCSSRIFPPTNPASELMSWTEHAVIGPLGFIVQAVPISPGGVGVGEAAFAGLYKLSGKPETRGVIARLGLRVAEWLLALVGVIVYLQMKAHHELPTEEPEKSDDDPPKPTG